MAEHGKIPDEGDLDYQKNYRDIKDYEHHFNNIELEIRKLASVWLLAALGAIAYLIRGAYLSDDEAGSSEAIAGAEAADSPGVSDGKPGPARSLDLGPDGLPSVVEFRFSSGLENGV